MPTDEEKLLAILDQPEPECGTDELESAPEDLDEAEETSPLDALQRTTLQGLLESNMPSPEEILRDAKIAEHNDEVCQRREENLARRRERRAKNPQRRRRR
jgi:hypothetical protein